MTWVYRPITKTREAGVYMEQYTEWLNETYEKMVRKLTVQTKRVGTMIPFVPRNGRYGDLGTPHGLSFWTNGFWPGILWQMYHATGQEIFCEAAKGVEERMDSALHDFEGLYHDVGFMFMPSAVANYRMTGNDESRRRGMHAATLLAGRFNMNGNFIRAWNEDDQQGRDVRGYMIVDCLMNLSLLFWASNESKDPRFARIAREHANTALKYLVREDGSCNHIANFDPGTGEFLGNLGGQGYSEDSSWSRGQGWALYGYALCCRYTGDITYLDTAKRCAHYCISNLAVNNWIPAVDFRAPKEHAPKEYAPKEHAANESARPDTSAGVIIACGLLELAEHVTEYEKKLYFDAAVNILRACESSYGMWDEEEDAILGGTSLQFHNDMLSGIPIIYGDYFFVEALLRLKEKALFIW